MASWDSRESRGRVTRHPALERVVDLIGIPDGSAGVTTGRQPTHPVQMLLLYMICWKPLPIGLNAETSGWHTERKCGRSPPISHLWNTWKTAPVTAGQQIPFAQVDAAY